MVTDPYIMYIMRNSPNCDTLRGTLARPSHLRMIDMPTCRHCEAEYPGEHYDRVVHNQTSLHGPWAGWRMTGKDLVGPDGVRISPVRMRGSCSGLTPRRI